MRPGLEQDDAAITLGELPGDHAAARPGADHDDIDVLVQPGTPGR